MTYTWSVRLQVALLLKQTVSAGFSSANDQLITRERVRSGIRAKNGCSLRIKQGPSVDKPMDLA